MGGGRRGHFHELEGGGTTLIKLRNPVLDEPTQISNSLSSRFVFFSESYPILLQHSKFFPISLLYPSDLHIQSIKKTLSHIDLVLFSDHLIDNLRDVISL